MPAASMSDMEMFQPFTSPNRDTRETITASLYRQE